ncbi:MAG: RecQ family ATP-dependent DNA helicase [Bacteroidales bacterium]|nr:RecQ family ATP-dependent DNA helicase [Bacteroidales bacterium]
MELEQCRKILTKYWGFTSFRPLQEEIIKSVIEGKDTLGLMPTGGGKSLTFQVPGIALDGICLVITPLIALMKEQVAKLNSMEIRTLMIHSGLSREEIEITLDNCIFGDYKFLYLSPERITTPLFRKKAPRLNVSLVAVDEAHCISQWGYDFRPSYLRIPELRELLQSDPPFLALTASATKKVADDIMDKLAFRQKNVLQTSFERKNISYIVRKVEDKGTYLVNTLGNIRGTGIVYVRSRKKSREVAELISGKGFSADFYHAGLAQETRDRKQKAWMEGKTKIIVATNAFGMGIDKPDVRFVIHWDIPDSIESYFQETGRAGRDGKQSWAVLLFTEADKNRLMQSVAHKFPPVEKIKDTYELLCNHLQLAVGSGKDTVHDFNMQEFVAKYRLPVIDTYNSLLFLQREGYLEFTEEINNPSRVHFLVGRDDLYKFQVANEAYDKFIKLLLRSYTGMFTEYVIINEDSLAARAGVTRDTVYQFLVRLSALNIIHYIPGKKTPLIIFTAERLERKSLYISPENYLHVREKYISRLNKMIEYAETDTKCRSVMLLSYFGEEAERCGNCDVCRQRNELELSEYEFDLILKAIKEILLKENPDAASLAEKTGYPPDKAGRVIRWLLDHKKIVPDINMRLRWAVKE